MSNDVRGWITALRASHDRLTGIAGGLEPAQVTAPSYCEGWSVAQVLSHLGSGAEIGLANLEAALAGAPAPTREDYQAIWDRWNAKAPAEAATDALVADERHVVRVEGLTGAELASVSMPFMGRELDATGIVGLRLGEHAVHTWDVEVSFDKSAVLLAQAVDLMVDLMPARAVHFARGERPAAVPVEIAVETHEPARSWSLQIAEDVVLAETPKAPKGRLTLGGEALVRLVYGRLDAGHTPAEVKLEGPVSLDELRVLFPGF